MYNKKKQQTQAESWGVESAIEMQRDRDRGKERELRRHKESECKQANKRKTHIKIDR